MRFRLVVLVCLSLLLGSAVSHATLTTITAPSGTISSAYNRFAISAIPYDPLPEQVLSGVPLNTQLCRWDNDSQQAVAYGLAFGNIAPGDHYEYLYSTQAYPVSFQGFPFPADTDAWIPLGGPEGATYIGNPLGIAVLWDYLCVTDGQVIYAAENTNFDYLLQAYGYSWDNSTQSQFDAGATRWFSYDDMFRPWYGYQMYPVVANTALIVPHDGALPYIDANNSIADAKLEDDGSYVGVSMAVVTYIGDDFFYVEQPNRISGIRVAAPPVEVGVTLGDRLPLSGEMATDADGERYLVLSDVGSIVPGSTLERVGMCNKFVGGGDWNYDPQTGAGQQGVTGGWGLNNIGLLATVWGRFHYVGQTTFTLDDGTGNPITCKAPPGYEVNVSGGWKYLSVTGIVSCYQDGSNQLAEILVRDVSDLSVLHGASTYTAGVSVNASTVTGHVSPRLFGSNASYRDMNLALKANEQPWIVVSGQPELDVNQCIVDYASALNLGVLRFLGGNEYRWRMGVGPVSNRPKQTLDPGLWTVSYFGTDELMAFCGLIGCNSVDMVVNALQNENKQRNCNITYTRNGVTYCAYQSRGLGNLELAKKEAANWVEYCNSEVTQSVLNTAIASGWRPTKYVEPEDVPNEAADEEPLPFAVDEPWPWAHNYASVEWSDTHLWNGSLNPNPTCWCAWEDAPTGYFAWLRRYFAWQRAGSPVNGQGQPTWKSLTEFTESSYGAPYGVQYWEIGNETYWEDQWSSIMDYTDIGGLQNGDMASQFAYSMKQVDSSIEVGASIIGADSTDNLNWDEHTIEACDSNVDFVVPHYYGSLGSLTMEEFVRCDLSSSRTMLFPTAGDYTFRVTARVDPEVGDTPMWFDLSIDGGAPAHIVVHVDPRVLAATVNVPTSGNHTVTLSNPHRRYDDPSTHYNSNVHLYRVTMEGPSVPEQSIWFPDDIEQQIHCNDYTVQGDHLRNLKDQIEDSQKSLDIYITETSQGYPLEGRTEAGYLTHEVQHQLRFKAALWLPPFLRMLSEEEASLLCHFNLFDSGYWGVIRRPYYMPYPASTEYDDTPVTPSYHLLKMLSVLKDADSVQAMVTSSPAFTDLSGYPDAPRRSQLVNGIPTWISTIPKPSGIKQLEAFACKRGSTLYLVVSNRAPQSATTTFNISGASLVSSGYSDNVTTLSVLHLQDRPERVVGNVYPELEAYNETRTLSAATTPDEVRLTTATLNNVSGSFNYTFAPFSITLIELATSN